jgi:hypothetical protein
MISISEQTLIRTSYRTPAPSWCEACAKWVNVVRPDLAAIIASVSVRTLYQWIETGKLHYFEEPKHGPLVCLNSLGPIDDPTKNPATMVARFL